MYYVLRDQTDRGIIVVLCDFSCAFTHTPHHRLAHTSEIRTVLEAYWLVRAPVPTTDLRQPYPTAG